MACYNLHHMTHHTASSTLQLVYCHLMPMLTHVALRRPTAGLCGAN